MLIDVQRRAPQEACGLIAGVQYTCLAVFPISNDLQSPVRFRMAPQEQLEAREEEQGLDW